MMLLLTQPSVLLAVFAARAHCWFIVSSLSTNIPRSFAAELLPNDEYIKWDRSQDRLPWYSTCYWPPGRVQSINHSL